MIWYFEYDPEISPDDIILIDSDIEIADVLKNGYEYQGMPCGMMTYTKEIQDTFLMYWFIIEDKRSFFQPSNYPYNNDSSSLFYPFNRRLIKNSINTSLGKEVEINFDFISYKDLSRWFLSKNAFAFVEDFEFAIKNNKGFYVFNHIQKLYVKCFFDVIDENKKGIKGTLSIRPVFPFLDYKKYKFMSDFDEYRMYGNLKAFENDVLILEDLTE